MDKEVDIEEIEYDEKNSIRMAVKEFADEMLKRMLAKYDEGKRGWDDPEMKNEIFSGLCNACQKTKWVDVANFAMMLWRFDKEKK
jgi:hypothetical protein